MNQWLNPLKRETGSNLVDAGREAVQAGPIEGEATRKPDIQGGHEATRKVCGVPVAMLQGKSWTSILACQRPRGIERNCAGRRRETSGPSGKGSGCQCCLVRGRRDEVAR